MPFFEIDKKLKNFFQELNIKMKEAENEDGEGKRKVEALWVSF